MRLTIHLTKLKANPLVGKTLKNIDEYKKNAPVMIK